MVRTMRLVGVVTVFVVASSSACSIEAPKPEAFQGEGFVVGESGSVTLSDRVPRVDPATCPAGRVLTRTASGWSCVELTYNDLATAPLSCRTGDLVQRTASGWDCAPVPTGTVTQTSTTSLARVIAGPGLIADVDGLDVTVSVDFGATMGADTVARSDHAHAVEQEVADARGTHATLLARLEALERQIAGAGGMVDPDCPTGYTRTASITTFVLCTRGNDHMVRVGDLWIDRYEAVVVDASVWNDGRCSGTSGNVYGTTGPGFPATFPENGSWTAPLHACSRAGGLPSRYVSWFQANQACALSGKHLPSMAEWQVAVGGTPDPGAHDGLTDTRCNTDSSGTRATGGATNCTSRYGAEDMVGNLCEWVGMWAMEPGFNGTPTLWPTNTGYGGDGYYRGGDVTGPPNGSDGSHENGDHTAVLHLPSAVILGGGFRDQARAGSFTVGLGYAPSYVGEAVGFRCALRR